MNPYKKIAKKNPYQNVSVGAKWIGYYLHLVTFALGVDKCE
jgi:hypothetical protein